jgi:preprotein translocase subunit SecG
MHTVIVIVHVFVSVFMILVILLQPGKDGGMAGMGGGTSASAFGGRGSATFLSKVTTVCAAIFMITSLSLAYLSSKTESAVLAHQAPASAKPAAAAASGATGAAPAATGAVPAAPAAPAAPAPAAPATPAPTPAPAPAQAGK